MSSRQILEMGEDQNMQIQTERDVQVSEPKAPVSSSLKRDRMVTRKVTIRLAEKLHTQLAAATDRPGVGKSMVVAAALEQFMKPGSSVEELAHERFDEMNARFDRLEHDIRVLAETVALHARYHFSVIPPLPQPEQREASARGDERFRVLAGQVDRRVRLGRSLMQETIDRLNVTELGGSTPASDENAPPRYEPGPAGQKAGSEAEDIPHQSSAAAGEGGSNSNFHQRSSLLA
jgi:hypothetical protein